MVDYMYVEGLKTYNEEILIIEPGMGFKHYWRDIWRYRELFYLLAWRDILVRYKQTVIGTVWSVLRPFLTMTAFTIEFSKLVKLPSNWVPHTLTRVCGYAFMAVFCQLPISGKQALSFLIRDPIENVPTRGGADYAGPIPGGLRTLQKWDMRSLQ